MVPRRIRSVPVSTQQERNNLAKPAGGKSLSQARLGLLTICQALGLKGSTSLTNADAATTREALDPFVTQNGNGELGRTKQAMGEGRSQAAIGGENEF